VSARVVVVGGGVSGLAAAHRLLELGRQGAARAEVTLLEAAERLGGQVCTERDGEFLFEGGADTLLAQKPWGLELCGRLGLAGELEDIGARHTGTQILHRGQLVRVPEGFLMMAPTRIRPVLGSSLFSWRGKLRMLAEPLVAKRPADRDDEGLTSFVTRRFGREVAERVAEPVIAGLYTADASRLSLRMTMPRFLDLEAQEGSVTRGLRRAARARGSRPFGHGTGGGGFVALRGGLGRIVSQLAARLPEGSVRTGSRATAVRRSGGGFTVAVENGDTVAADAVVLACPAYVAARLVRTIDQELSGSLETLRYASCSTVHLVYPRADVGAALSSFGFFVPRTEGLPILACSYVSEKFEGRAPREVVVLRAFLGGATRPGILDEADDEIVRAAHGALAGVLRLSARPVLSRVHRHPQAMPQYDVGARDWVASIQARAQRHAGLFFTGSTVGAVGIPDCVRAAESVAERVLGDSPLLLTKTPEGTATETRREFR
jgi:protoporphyrinogen/coproporphyrinogen III oxidase